MENDAPAPKPPPIPKPPRSALAWWVHMLVIGSYPLVLGVLGHLMDSEGQGPALGSTAGDLVQMAIIELGIFGTIFAIGWSASRATVDDLYLRWRSFWAPLLGLGYSVGLRLGLGIVVIIGVGIVSLFSGTGFQELAEGIRPDVQKMVDYEALAKDPLYMFLNVTLISFVVAGLREELWRAGFLAAAKHLAPGIFSGTKGQLAAAALASVVFGLGHLTMGWSAVLLTGLLGFGLGAIMVLHRSIWEAVIAHGCFNATTFILLPVIQEHLPDALK